MSRIDQYFDGEIERGALEPEERIEAEVVERAIGELQDLVDARPTPDLSHRVMRSIEDARVTARPSLLARVVAALWIHREMSFRTRPAYMLAAAAGLSVMLVAWVTGQLPLRPSSVQTTQVGTTFVQFRLQAPDASSVRLAGTFTNWQPDYELHQSEPGIWTITVPLPVGVHDYAFIIDGTHWTPDPYAPSVDDGFGGKNSRIALLPPESSRS